MGNDGLSGAAIGLSAIALAEAEEASKSARRMKNKGSDQVLIETKLSPSQAATRIAALWSNTFADEAVVKIKGKGFSVAWFFGGFGIGILLWFGLGLAIAIIALLLNTFISIDRVVSIDLVFTVLKWAFPVVCVSSAVLGGYLEGQDKEVAGVRIERIHAKTFVLLQTYDDDGRRIYDQMQIYKIRESLEANAPTRKTHKH